MKRAITRVLPVLMICCIGFYEAGAQYVTIPDTAFVSWLQNNGYATCMSGNQLDTTSPLVRNTTGIFCVGYAIANMEGVEYFRNLDSLECSADNSFTSTTIPALTSANFTYLTLEDDNLGALPSWISSCNVQTLICGGQTQLVAINALPPNLVYLDCSASGFTGLPALPATLRRLICGANGITALPSLPAGLQYLDCTNGEITELPSLPSSLDTLICPGTYLYSLPPLPSGLVFINCSNDSLTSLPALPAALNFLNCYNNELTSLPALPASLQYLYCDYNNLASLPAIPASLLILNCSNNQISAIPAISQATGLTGLYCNFNALNSTLPALPNSLIYLNCSNNSLHSLPALPPVLSLLDCSYNNLQSIPANTNNLIGQLTCSHNQLTTFPVFNFSSLTQLYCSSNQLTSIPDLNTWPDQILELYCDSNPLLTCLPGFYHVLDLNFSGTAIACVPSYTTVGNSTPAITSLPLCQQGNIHGCSVALSANAGNDTTICLGSSVTLGGSTTAVGGTPPYNYVWAPSTGLLGQTTSNPVAGPSDTTTYTVIVTDANNITASASITVEVKALAMDSLPVINVSCHGANNGSVCVYVSGIVSPYSWSTGATTQCITGLAAGTYTVTVTNTNGCTSASSAIVGQPTPISFTPTVNNEPCYGQSLGSIVPTVTGSVAPYVYLWSNGATSQSITGLTAGTYNITITDSHACTGSYSATVAQPLQLVIDTIYTGGGTCGTNNGTLVPEVTGGTPGYTYVWSNTQTGQNITGLTAGTYCTTITDSHDCTATGCGTISTSSPVVIDSIHITNLTCYGGNNGGFCVYASGGGSFTYSWSNGAIGPCITGLASGIYSVTVTNSSNCTATASATITQPAQLIIDSLPVTYVTCVANNATITSYVTGGTAPYEYLWSNSATITTITNLSTGTYILTVIDANACSATNSAVVNQPAVVTIDSFHITNVACHDSANGSICVYTTGAGGPSPYNWSNGDQSQCITQLNPGTYVITVTSSAGCTASAAATVTQPTVLKDSIAIGNCSFCDYASGGTPPYFYIWANGQITACITSLSIGTYTTTVSDANGCTVQDAAMTLSNLQFQVFTPDTNAVPDSVSLLISGGLSPYSVVWGDGQSTTEIDSETLHIYSTTGFYYLHISDSLGCTTTQYRVDAGCSDQCVWPGDANYDGVVNNNDLLAIGLGYDSTGYPRLHPTIDFIPQYCQSWADTLMGGINYKHVDCNGDGIINAADTSAIMLNYGDTHPRNGGRSAWKSDAPGLYVSVSPDTLVDGQIATAALSLGDSAFPATNVYALAFTYNFDPLVVDTGSVSISFGNSWLASSGDHINISKNFYGPGQVQAALTRINHLNRTGQGTIATVSMKITTGNINGKNLQYYLMNNFISNLTVIDNLGNVLTFNEGADSVEIAFMPTGILPTNANANIQMFPNPATDQLNITTGATGIEDISIVDLTGQLVYHQSTGTATNITIDISQLSAGVYMVNMKAVGREYHNRFVKINVK